MRRVPDLLQVAIGLGLVAGLTSSDTVARIGGDEFAILMSEIGASPAGAVIERVRGG
jgi:GGDEF domain-containing protein